MALNREKMKNLILHIVSRSEPTMLGAVKLNKILWFTDINAYLQFGDSITGETYIKRQFGPVPQHIHSILDELAAENRLCVRESSYYEYPKIAQNF